MKRTKPKAKPKRARKLTQQQLLDQAASATLHSAALLIALVTAVTGAPFAATASRVMDNAHTLLHAFEDAFATPTPRPKRKRAKLTKGRR